MNSVTRRSRYLTFSANSASTDPTFNLRRCSAIGTSSNTPINPTAVVSTVQPKTPVTLTINPMIAAPVASA
ncbi:hypothetical protein D3C83_203760 [compost metagenome]